ncbi:hypothetical protein FM038_005460 [Shewanella eurypsychrophilus]|uniref:Uncharacterized protein n=1 Tax=Shewanella eurypsychrophilus TaxID=2593656 RepID=A0ABX6V516_9GAMM|nr:MULTISPECIES: hypothetical protein [Shewanella]QFU21653.1 hypothetical protein FS418_07040 [Shewanella sp. YLB-09]QPG56943.1 hypothetical protein FM038_005460 [Shewanella eurypsychrophilus]
MKFLVRAVLLLGSLVWLVVCAKQLVSLGVVDNPSVAMDNTQLLIQGVIALIILRSTWGSKRNRDSY